MTSPIVESFSLTHAAILHPKGGGELFDVYGVRSGSVEIDSDSYSNTGDDTIQSVWNWFNLATITIESGYISFDMLERMTNSTISINNDVASTSLWNINSLNVNTFPMLLRTAAKKSDGSTGFLDIIMYRVQFQPIRLDGPSYKNGLSVSYTGQALMSFKDERGNTLVDPSVGRLRYSTREIIVPALQVHENPDGTYTMIGDSITDNNDGTYTIDKENVIDNGDGTYTIRH